jgi:hypothetical protein
MNDLEAIQHEQREFSQELLSLEEFYHFSKSDIWVKLKQHMDEEVDLALQDMQGNVSGNTQITANLSWRWQQRNTMALSIKQHVQKHVDAYLELMEELKRGDHTDNSN